MQGSLQPGALKLHLFQECNVAFLTLEDRSVPLVKFPNDLCGSQVGLDWVDIGGWFPTQTELNHGQRLPTRGLFQ